MYALDYTQRSDGPALVGPFGSEVAAQRYADKQNSVDSYEVRPLHVPELT